MELCGAKLQSVQFIDLRRPVLDQVEIHQDSHCPGCSSFNRALSRIGPELLKAHTNYHLSNEGNLQYKHPGSIDRQTKLVPFDYIGEAIVGCAAGEEKG
jgi:hypothetical protein